MHFRLKNSRDKTFFPLTGLLKQLGRSMDCDIVVSDPQVSRLHARLEKSETGWVIVDLESQNGTMVNGVKVREKTLHPGDVIHFGATCFIYEIEEAIEESDESTRVDPEISASQGWLSRVLGGKKEK